LLIPLVAPSESFPLKVTAQETALSTSLARVLGKWLCRFFHFYYFRPPCCVNPTSPVQTISPDSRPQTAVNWPFLDRFPDIFSPAPTSCNSTRAISRAISFLPKFSPSHLGQNRPDPTTPPNTLNRFPPLVSFTVHPFFTSPPPHFHHWSRGFPFRVRNRCFAFGPSASGYRSGLCSASRIQ